MDIQQFSLKGKVALVTGANRGIGAATAIGFAKAGADVAIVSRNTPNRGLTTLEEVAEEIKACGQNALPVSAHLGHTDQIKGLVETVVARFGRIDILVNNAGTSNMTPVLDVKEELWDAIMNLNLKGLFFLSQAAARVMKEHGGGKIINVSSVDGYKPEPDIGVYSISKAAVIMATKVMALDLAKYNIRVNGIAPGLIDTRLLNSKYQTLSEAEAKKQKEETLKLIPAGRIGTPREIADAMIFLASDASSYVTGQTFIVDGGFLI
ncbi:MAG: 3-oxoacyl-ACP reductase FabG [Dehalococcoidales bacterium]|nr:3-oxoacyl-ACP reductase FabG [Dehalococcoidales bacterium]